MNRQWNVVATLAVILSLSYVALSAWALLTGQASYANVREGLNGVTMAVLGYLARMLHE